MMQPTDNRRTTGGRPGINKNSSLGGVAGNQQATDGQPMMQPTDNRRTTGGTLLSILDPNPDPEPNKTTTAPGTKAGNNPEDAGGGPGGSQAKKKNPLQRIKEKRPDWISRELWGELIDNRKMKKLSNSDLALTTFLNAVQKAVAKGYAPDDCIAEFVQTRWTRFNVDWMPDLSPAQGMQPRNMTEAHNMQCDSYAKLLLADRRNNKDAAEQAGKTKNSKENHLLEYPVSGEQTNS
jgi:hypothetical protein